jgi:hypothetical protein
MYEELSLLRGSLGLGKWILDDDEVGDFPGVWGLRPTVGLYGRAFGFGGLTSIAAAAVPCHLDGKIRRLLGQRMKPPESADANEDPDEWS